MTWRTRWHIFYWFYQLAGRRRLLAHEPRPRGVLVVDDGFAHRAVHVHGAGRRKVDRRRLSEYLDVVPAPDFLIHVETATDVSLERVTERGVWAHSRHLQPEALASYLDTSLEIVEGVVASARDRNWQIVHVSGKDEPARTASKLGDAVGALIGEPAPASVGVGRIARVPRRSRAVNRFAARMQAPSITPTTVGEILEAYGLEPRGAIDNVWLSRRNRNVMVGTSAGSKLVKMYRPQWNQATVECGHSILRRLEELGFPAPRLVRTPHGLDQVSTHDGVAAVFDRISGTNLSLFYLLRPDRLALTADAAATLAGLHRALRGFVPSGQHHLGFDAQDGSRRRDIAWFARTLEVLTESSLGLPDGHASSVASQLTARAQEMYASLEQLDRKIASADFERLVIHGDFGIHNLLFRRDLPTVPVDFELSRLDWRMFDLISALGKHRFRSGAYDFESMKAFMDSYGVRFPLTSEERVLFPDAWQLYKLRAAVQYWHSYFATDGPVRKLHSAVDALDQADWAIANAATLAQLATQRQS